MSNRTRLGDDVIMAHVDGALPEKVNEQDAGSRRRGKALKEVSRLAHAAYQDVLEEPAPLDLKQRLSNATVAAPIQETGAHRAEETIAQHAIDDPGPSSAAQASTQQSRNAVAANDPETTPYSDQEDRSDKLRQSARRHAHRRRERAAQIVSALLLMAMAGFMGFWIGEREGAGVPAPSAEAVATAPAFDERILPGMAIFTALEAKLSGETVEKSRMMATPRMTYRTSGGEVCRQYELSDGARAVIGVACRLPDSRWQPRVSVEAVVQDGVVRTVPGGAAALEAYLVSSMATDAMSHDQESQLIAQGW